MPETGGICLYLCSFFRRPHFPVAARGLGVEHVVAEEVSRCGRKAHLCQLSEVVQLRRTVARPAAGLRNTHTSLRAAVCDEQFNKPLHSSHRSCYPSHTKIFSVSAMFWCHFQRHVTIQTFKSMYLMCCVARTSQVCTTITLYC